MRIPVMGMISLFLLTLLCDIYIFRDIAHYARARRRRVWLWLYAAFSANCIIFLIVTLCMPRRDGDAEITPVR